VSWIVVVVRWSRRSWLSVCQICLRKKIMKWQHLDG